MTATKAPVWRNRIVGHGEAKPDDLLPNPLNWRGHPALQRAALAGVLSEVGWVQQVVVNRTTGHLIDGHLRVEMARGKGEPVPYVEVELSQEEEEMVLATLDPLGALATTDQDALSALLARLNPNDEALVTLLDRLQGESALPGKDDLVDDEGTYSEAVIGFEVSTVVQSPQDRDKASDALTTAGLVPHVRTLHDMP